MSLELKQHLKMSQQLVMTPQLQQAIKLLQLSRMELVDLIRTEMNENPLLDEAPTSERGAGRRAAPARPRPGRGAGRRPAKEAEKAEEVKGEEGANEIDWDQYLDHYQLQGHTAPVQPRTWPTRTCPASRPPSPRKGDLADHLVWQLRLSDFTRGGGAGGHADHRQPRRRRLLHACRRWRARPTRRRRAIRWCGSPSRRAWGSSCAEQVLKKVQPLDPIGVAARDLRECLLLQVAPPQRRHARARGHHQAPPEAPRVEELPGHRPGPEDPPRGGGEGGQGHQPRSSPSRAATTPARTRSTSPPTSTSTRWATGTSPCSTTTASPSSASPAPTAPRSRTAQAGKAKEYIQDKLRSAVWLIRSIHQRQRTIYKVTESIVKFQRDFLDKGIAHLKPLILRDVAEDIGMHESTVSRVTTNKYVHTPQGIFELKFFFNSAITAPAATRSPARR